MFQSPLPAMTASPNQYVYPASAAMALHPGELVYAQHGTQGYSATDLTDAATVQAQIEAAAQPAEVWSGNQVSVCTAETNIMSICFILFKFEMFTYLLGSSMKFCPNSKLCSL